jgi:hypothetical protein
MGAGLGKQRWFNFVDSEFGQIAERGDLSGFQATRITRKKAGDAPEQTGALKVFQ